MAAYFGGCSCLGLLQIFIVLIDNNPSFSKNWGTLLGIAELEYGFCPHPQPLSQAWERGARAEGSGGVRANHT
jgi:hypothetical protein